MAKFKRVPQTFLFQKLLKYWGNMTKNFDGDCRDDDFFDIVRNCFDHDKAVELIELAYSEEDMFGQVLFLIESWVWRVLTKLKIELPHNLAIPFLGICLEKAII